jgi:hypothetical protein
MITVNSTVLTIWLDSWGDGGCPVLYFIIEYHDMHRSNDWVLVSNNVQPMERAYSILDLVPATTYHLRVTAHNNAGSTVAFYNFTTLTAEGGNISLDFQRPHLYTNFSFPFCGCSHPNGGIICTRHWTLSELCMGPWGSHTKFSQKSFEWRNHFKDLGIDGGVLPTSPRNRGFM